MSGQLLKATPKAPKPKHTHVVFEFTQGTQLRFVDPRTFGEAFVVDPARLAEEAPDLAELGWDPLEDPAAVGRLRPARAGRRQQLKALLTDQKVIAGLGQHLQRRDPPRRRAALRPAVQHADRAGGAPAVPGHASRSSTRRWRPGAAAWPTSSTSTCTASRAATRTSTRSTAARARRACAAGPRSSAPSGAAAPPSTAPLPGLAPVPPQCGDGPSEHGLSRRSRVGAGRSAAEPGDEDRVRRRADGRH